MTAEEALLAAEAAILFKVAGLPGPDYYSTRAESPRISWILRTARVTLLSHRARSPAPNPRTPAHPPGAPRSTRAAATLSVVT